jgi:hypothetical protein
LRPLLEGMKNVDSLCGLRDVDDSMIESGVHTNLTNPDPYGRKGFPVVRLKSTLNSPELKARHLSRIGGEPAHILSGRPEPHHGGLGGHGLVYKYQYLQSSG